MPIELDIAIPEQLPEHALRAMEQAVSAALAMEGAPSDACMAMLICDEDTIRKINRDMRGIDAITDVLSFPSRNYPVGTVYSRLVTPKLPREAGHSVLGDAVICLPRARSQAEEFGHSLTRELAYLTAHSALHMLGYDHMTEEDKAVMRPKEQEIMEHVGLYRDEELLEKAVSALESSYSPYSRFRVGACLLGSNGKVYTGANIENASYGATICAERAALCRAVMDGCRVFSAIAIAGDTAPWPCGICRQALYEFSDDMRVIVGTKAGIAGTAKLADLLPHAFGPQDLEEMK